MRICISAGHSAKCRGASGYIDEFDENVRVVDRVAEILGHMHGVKVHKFIDRKSTTQDQNLRTICDWHNSHDRDLDVSVHFNSTDPPGSKPIGTEVWYQTQEELASMIATAIADAGHLIDRGPKYSSGLYFLTHTEKPAVLLEVCFVSSKKDCDLYEEHFEKICHAIAHELAGKRERPEPPAGVAGDWHDNITATVFGNPGDEQEGAYGGWIDSNTEGVSFPYKWRDSPRPTVEVQGPQGSWTGGVVDVGPWNTDDPGYVLGSARPLAELQYDEGTEAQNGRVPTNDAGIDLTVPVDRKSVV